MVDIVDDFLCRLQQHIPDAAPEVRFAIETSIRKEWGGNKPYVRQAPSMELRTFMVANGLRHAKPLADIFKSAGVSRRTGYRILSRK